MTNDLTPDELKTLDFYKNTAKEWHKGLAVGSDNLLFETELNEFKSLLGSGKVLEIGCGAGNDAKWFLEQGYDYTGIDISSEMVDLSRSRVKGGNFQVMSVYSLNFPNKVFDGFWSSLTLIHIPKNKLENALDQIRKVVRSGGIGFVSMKEGVGEKFEENKKRFYAYYSPEEFEGLLKKAGFETIVKSRKSLGKTKFLTFFVKVLNEK